MSTADPDQAILTGENPFIRLSARAARKGLTTWPEMAQERPAASPPARAVRPKPELALEKR